MRKAQLGFHAEWAICGVKHRLRVWNMRFWSGSDVSDGRDHHLLAEIAGRKKRYNCKQSMVLCNIVIAIFLKKVVSTFFK